MLHLARYALSSAWMTLKLVGWQPQVVFVVAPALFCAPAPWLAARPSGAKAWLHVQDFEVGAACELGMLGGFHVAPAVVARGPFGQAAHVHVVQHAGTTTDAGRNTALALSEARLGAYSNGSG